MQTFEAALTDIDSEACKSAETLAVHSCGTFSVKCERCQARFFLDERLSKSSCSKPKFSLCCGDGKVTLWPIPEPSQPLANLLTGSATNCRQLCPRNDMVDHMNDRVLDMFPGESATL